MIDLFITNARSTALAVTALLALVLLTRRAVTRRFGARVAYALWLLPILRLVTPPMSLPAEWGVSRWFGFLSAPTTPTEPLYIGYYNGVVGSPNIEPSLTFADIWPTAITSIWLAGVILGSIWIVIRQRRYAHRVRLMSVTPNAALQVEIARAVRLTAPHKTPEVRVSLNNDGPMVCGLFRPVIILPSTFAAQFTAKQRQLALIHELSHVRRGDLWTASAMMGFRVINWPNPLAHLAWSRFRADQEAACDATVLRLTGEDARANYAETLLTAAKTATQTSGRASPMSGTGLTLSLHHPIKERLMTLGTSNTSRRGASRWGLAALLLTGAALTAPLSLADGPTPPKAPETTTTTTTSQKSVHVVRAEFTEDGKDGYEIRNQDGVKTYLRVNRDGTTENLTRAQLEADYDIDVDALLRQTPPSPPTPPRFTPRVDGEPGLNALTHSPNGVGHRMIIMRNINTENVGRLEVKNENGVRRVFHIDADGSRTEIAEDEIGEAIDIETMIVRGENRFPMVDGDREIHVITSNSGSSEWTSNDGAGSRFHMGLLNDQSSTMAEAQLSAAQSLLESTDEMLSDLRENAAADAQRDLRDAERQLEKARKALEKARVSVEKSGDR